MIKVTVGQFLSGKLDEFEDLREHHIYIFKDGDIALYVGQAGNVITRLWEHIGPLPGYPYEGRFYDGPSRVGKLIEAKVPGSLFWEIEILTVEECQERKPGTPPSIDWAERAMIIYYKPILNAGSCGLDSEILARYRLPIPEAFIKSHSEIFDD